MQSCLSIQWKNSDFSQRSWVLQQNPATSWSSWLDVRKSYFFQKILKFLMYWIYSLCRKERRLPWTQQPPRLWIALGCQSPPSVQMPPLAATSCTCHGWALKHHQMSENFNKIEGMTIWCQLKYFQKKSHNAEKTKSVDPSIIFNISVAKHRENWGRDPLVKKIFRKQNFHNADKNEGVIL